MSTNYRSMPQVIRFINGVMRRMMTEDVGGVEYTGGQCLQPVITSYSIHYTKLYDSHFTYNTLNSDKM